MQRSREAILKWRVPAGQVLLAILVLLALVWASEYEYLLFHTLVELFSIIVACAIFVIAWNSRRFWDNGYFLFLGIAYLFVGGIDLVHTLAYKGMPVFPGYRDDTNLPTQLWICARYLESISLVLAVVFLRRRLRAGWTMLGLTVVFAGAIAAVFSGAFPVCFLEGSGLTTFKIASEYAISATFAAAAVLLLWKRSQFDREVLALTVASIVVSIASELSFTRYAHAYGLANEIGHYFKLLSFYLIYRAVIQTGLTKPYRLLFRNLKRAEEALREANVGLERRVAERTAELSQAVDRLEVEVRERIAAEEDLQRERQTLFSVLQMLPGFVALQTRDGRYRFVNDRFLDLFGDPGGRRCHEVVRGRSQPCQPCPLQAVFEGEAPVEWDWTTPDESTFHIWGYPFTDPDGTKLALELGIDITARKRLEQEVLRVSELEQRRIGQDLHDSLGQMLSGVSCLSEVLHRRLAAKDLPEADSAAEIQSILAESVGLTRLLARGLDPVGLDPDSFMEALGELAVNLQGMFGVRLEFRCERPVLVADSMAARHLFRIAQEAASNGLRHGRAGTIIIELTESDGEIVLSILDDGIGLPDGLATGDGMGLRIMAHRADAIGAHLSIRRRAEGGTAVVCRVPKAAAKET